MGEALSRGKLKMIHRHIGVGLKKLLEMVQNLAMGLLINCLEHSL